MATKSKRKATKSKTKSKSGNGAGKPGVIATIAEFITRTRGATIEELGDHLKSKFPDRKRDSMIATCRIQAPKHAKKTEKDEKRGGTVYYG